MPLLSEQMEVLLLRLKSEGAGNIPCTRRAPRPRKSEAPKAEAGHGLLAPLLSPEWEQQGRLG